MLINSGLPSPGRFSLLNHIGSAAFFEWELYGLYVQIPHVERVLLDELPPGLDVLAHQG